MLLSTIWMTTRCRAGAEQQVPGLQSLLCVLETMFAESSHSILEASVFEFVLGSSWCSLFLLETRMFRQPEAMSEPALKDSPVAIFWVSLPCLHACRLELRAPEVDH